MQQENRRKKVYLAKPNNRENEWTSLKKNSICRKCQKCISRQTLEADKGKKEKKVVGERRKQRKERTLRPRTFNALIPWRRRRMKDDVALKIWDPLFISALLPFIPYIETVFFFFLINIYRKGRDNSPHRNFLTLSRRGTTHTTHGYNT